LIVVLTLNLNMGALYSGVAENGMANMLLSWEFFSVVTFVLCGALAATVDELHSSRLHEAEQQLAREAAEKSNTSKAALMSSVSHELRTPLNGIIGFAGELLLSSDLTEEMSQGLDVIRHSGNMLLSVINELLDFSRLEQSKLKLCIRPVRIRGLLKSVEANLRIRAEKAKLKLDFVVKDAVPDVLDLDDVRLSQIIFNVGSNATKFTKAGGCVSIMIDASVLESDKHGVPLREGHVSETVDAVSDVEEDTVGSAGEGMASPQSQFVSTYGAPHLIVSPLDVVTDAVLLTIRIRDTGIGITSVDREHIFDEFYRAKRTETMPGTGLGLTITRKLVHNMHGTLAVESIVGRGTVVTVELPVAVSDETRSVHGTPSPALREILEPDGLATPDALSRIALSPPVKKRGGLKKQTSPALRASRTFGTPSHSKGNVLVADDNRIAQRLFTKILEREGYSVITVDDGAKAVECVAKSADDDPIDVILMDAQMPHVTGIQATRAIRRMTNPRLKRTPVIACTAQAFDKDRQLFMAAGADGFLSKPVDRKTMLEAIESVLKVTKMSFECRESGEGSSSPRLAVVLQTLTKGLPT
jgi:signal transduction histidine kinase/CheY-like chemotaxis protein